MIRPYLPRLGQFSKIAGAAFAAALIAASPAAYALMAQTISFAALPDMIVGQPAITVSASSTSGLPVSFSSSTPSVCAASGTNGTTVTALATGTCTISAAQPGNADYAAAADVSQSFTITADAPSFADVKLLLHMDGANGSTSFIDQAGHTMTANNGATIGTAQSMFGGAAMATNGSGYLSTPAAADLNLGSNDFTIELWAYATNPNGGWNGLQTLISQNQYGNSSNTVFNVFLMNGNIAGGVATGQNSYYGVIAGPALPLNSWNHIALVGHGNTLTLYLNGQNVGSEAYSPLASSTLPLTIGADAVGNGVFNGYIDEVRLTNGDARYTTNFTPAGPFPSPPVTVALTNPAPGQTISAFSNNPFASASASSTAGAITQVQFFNGSTAIGTATSAPYSISLNNLPLGPASLTAVATDSAGNTGVSQPITVASVGYYALLMHMDGANGSTSFIDQAGHTMTANNGATIGTAQSMFGGAAMATNGSGYLSTPAAADLNLGSNDFTIELWAYATNPNGGWNGLQTLISQNQYGNSSNTVFNVFLMNGNIAGGVATGKNSYYGVIAGPTLPLNSWNHIALVGHGNTLTLYLNGQNVGSEAYTPLASSAVPLTIGADAVGNGVFNGYIDEVRLTNGDARYTTNFTPAGPFPNSIITPGYPGSAVPAKVSLAAGVPASIGFVANSGQALDLAIGGVATTPAGGSVAYSLYNPDNSLLANFSANDGGAYALPRTILTQSGTYTLLSSSATAASYAATATLGTPPTVAVTSPAAAIDTLAPFNFTLAVATMANNGGNNSGNNSISQVQYFNGSTLIGTATQSPFSYAWNNIPPGTYNISAVATDNYGYSAASGGAAVAVTVGPPILVSLTAPATGNISGKNLTISATASQPGGGIAQLAFYNGNSLLGVITQPPYSITFPDLDPGNYSFTAVATDSKGHTVTSAAVNVTVVPEGAGGIGNGGSGVYDIGSDQLGTPRVITDQGKNIVWQWDDDEPFGNNRPSQDPNGTGNQFVFNLRFPGMYSDVETGTFYNYYRDYDPGIGGYAQSDPKGLYGGSTSTYAYGAGDPLRFSDPFGLEIINHEGDRYRYPDNSYTQQGDVVTVNTSITIYGPNASAALATRWQNAINNAWNAGAQNYTYGRCRIKFNVTVQADPDHNWWITADSADKYVYVTDKPGYRSNVRFGTWGTWAAGDSSWISTHEVGHFFGLPDDYRDVGGISQPLPGHAGHMMGDFGGSVAPHEISDILKNKSCDCQR